MSFQALAGWCGLDGRCHDMEQTGAECEKIVAVNPGC